MVSLIEYPFGWAPEVDGLQTKAWSGLSVVVTFSFWREYSMQWMIEAVFGYGPAVFCGVVLGWWLRDLNDQQGVAKKQKP